MPPFLCIPLFLSLPLSSFLVISLSYFHAFLLFFSTCLNFLSIFHLIPCTYVSLLHLCHAWRPHLQVPSSPGFLVKDRSKITPHRRTDKLVNLVNWIPGNGAYCYNVWLWFFNKCSQKWKHPTYQKIMGWHLQTYLQNTYKILKKYLCTN
jgi:hypothetical protein